MRGRPGRSGPGRPSSRVGGTADGPGGVPSVGARAAPSHLAAALTGLREPIVVLLLIIGFMSWISGKPLDGLLIILAGAGLAWDAGRRSRQTSPAVVSPAGASAATASPVKASPAEAGPTKASPVEASSVKADPAAPEDAVLTATAAAPRPAGVTAAGAATGAPPAPIVGGPPARARRRRPTLLAAGLAGGALYAVVVGSFSRYSWPATVAVAGLGAAVVAVGWRGPRHTRSAPPRPPAVGLALWGAVFVAACLWELWSLLEQPNLATSSYAHPTISTLTDPVLSTWAGRSVVLAAWLGLGWFLVEL
jgi:hypothetical protein